jgi:uncharacterized membrane protein YvbJ
MWYSFLHIAIEGDDMEKIKSLMKAKELSDEMTDEEIEDIMDALEDSEGQVLH